MSELDELKAQLENTKIGMDFYTAQVESQKHHLNEVLSNSIAWRSNFIMSQKKNAEMTSKLEELNEKLATANEKLAIYKSQELNGVIVPTNAIDETDPRN